MIVNKDILNKFGIKELKTCQFQTLSTFERKGSFSAYKAWWARYVLLPSIQAMLD